MVVGGGVGVGVVVVVGGGERELFKYQLHDPACGSESRRRRAPMAG